MASVTALELVNKVRRKHRFNDTSAFTDPQSKVIIDSLNTVIGEEISSYAWPWNVRHDGLLMTKPSYSGTDGSITNALSAFGIASFSGAITELTGNFITRIQFPDDANFGNTAFRVTYATKVSTAIIGTIETEWPGTTDATATYRTFAAEYLLPDTVGKIVSMRHEEQPIRLLEVNPWETFEEIMPRLHDYRDDSPAAVAVGGYATGTYNTTAGEEKLRAVVWPVPDESMALHYSYQRRVTELSATTDTLDGVPSEIVSCLVDIAFGQSCLTGVGNDVNMGRAVMMDAYGRLARMRMVSQVDPSRKMSFAPHDRNPAGRGNPLAYRYRDITGL